MANLTTINSADSLVNSRSVINDNFSTLNNALLAKSYVTVGTALGTDYRVTGTYADAMIQQALNNNQAVMLLDEDLLLQNTLLPNDGNFLFGKHKTRSVLKMVAGANISIMRHANYGTGNTQNVILKNFTLDQQGASQTGGGGIGMSGAQNWLLEDLIIKKVYRFAFLALHNGSASNNTGTITVTAGSEVVSGTDTLFSAELSVGSIIKTADNKFGRVAKVNSDTELILYRAWGYATETGVTYKPVTANSGHFFNRVEIHGTVNNSDNAGFGFCDYSIVRDCLSFGAAGGGCGFVPDHAKGMKFINVRAYNNNNSGFSAETSEDIELLGGDFYGHAVGNGVQFISGSTRCTAIGVHAYHNTNGFSVPYNSTSVPAADSNKFIGCYGYYNTGYGFRVDGTHGHDLDKCEAFNNNTGGFIQNTTSSRVPADVHYSGCRAYDNRTTKLQARGIWIVTGQNAIIENCVAKDSDHTTAGIVNTGTDTVIKNVTGWRPDKLYAQGNVTGATTFNRTNGDIITATLTGNLTVTLTAGKVAGDELTLILTQDGTGSRTATWPSNFKKAGGTLDLSAGAGAVDVIKMRWDGTNWREVSRSLNLS